MDKVIIEALIISLKIIALALPIAMVIGIYIAYIMSETNIKFKRIYEGLIILPVFLPPSALGYIILRIFGRSGIVGNLINSIFDKSIIFTWIAGVIVGVVVSVPIIYQSSKAGFMSVDDEIKQAAMELGASKFQVFMKITMPINRKNILSGVVLSFARIFGEFGATIMVAGNIMGKTQTVPMAMYYAIENNDFKRANILLAITLVISILIITVNTYLTKK